MHNSRVTVGGALTWSEQYTQPVCVLVELSTVFACVCFAAVCVFELCVLWYSQSVFNHNMERVATDIIIQQNDEL